MWKRDRQSRRCRQGQRPQRVHRRGVGDRGQVHVQRHRHDQRQVQGRDHLQRHPHRRREGRDQRHHPRRYRAHQRRGGGQRPRLRAGGAAGHRPRLRRRGGARDRGGGGRALRRALPHDEEPDVRPHRAPSRATSPSSPSSARGPLRQAPPLHRAVRRDHACARSRDRAGRRVRAPIASPCSAQAGSRHGPSWWRRPRSDCSARGRSARPPPPSREPSPSSTSASHATRPPRSCTSTSRPRSPSRSRGARVGRAGRFSTARRSRA